MLVEDVQQNPQRVLITTLAVLLPLFLLFSLRRQYSSDNWKRYDEDIFGMKDRSDDGIIKDSEQRQARMQREAAQENVTMDEFGELAQRSPEELGGECEQYKWLQTDEDIVVEARCPSDTHAKDCKVEITTNSISVIVGGREVVSGKLTKSVRPDDCFWELESAPAGAEEGMEKLLSVTLLKFDKTRGNKHWKSVVKGGPSIDTSKFGPPIIPVSENDPQGMMNALKG